MHPEIEEVIHRIVTDVIGGAADTAKESADALSALIHDSKATTRDEFEDEFGQACFALLDVLAGLAPPINLLHELMGAVEQADQAVDLEALKNRLLAVTESFSEHLATALEQIALVGANVLRDGDVCLTYSMSSTVWKIYRKAASQGKRISVVDSESRPANEGLWTVKEMVSAGIPITIGIDAALGVLMEGCSNFIVGADAITGTGDALCKVGTYPTALMAYEKGIPLYIAADTTKFDPLSLMGMPFPVREMPVTDIWEGEIPDLVTVRNPVFEIVPSKLIRGLITEMGLIHPASCLDMIRARPQSRAIRARIETWADKP
jgi:ribose 1,5-bisphosphate isomerase